MLELWDGIRKSDKQFSYSLESASNQLTCWLILCWNTFGVRTSHGRLWTHKTHHGPDLGEATTLPHIVYFAPLHGGYIQMVFLSWDSRREVPKLPGLGFLQLCRAIISCSDLQLGRGLKQSCSSCQELSNGVSHATYTHGSWVDSRLFVIGSQTASLTPGFSFCHNLCYRCLNGSYEPILDIYTSIAFQWYKKNLQCKFFWPL